MKNWKTYVGIFLIAAAGAFLRNHYGHSNNHNQKTEFIEIEIDSLYSIKVPNYLQKTDKLNPEASYQGVNTEKHAFLIVIDDLNTSNLTFENYEEFIKTKIKNGFIESSVYNRNQLKVGGFDAVQFNLKGSNNNESVYGLMTIVKGTLDFYQIFSWTALEDNESYFDEMKQVVNSFQEIRYK